MCCVEGGGCRAGKVVLLWQHRFMPRKQDAARLPCCNPNSASSSARNNSDTQLSYFTNSQNRRLVTHARPESLACRLLFFDRNRPKHTTQSSATQNAASFCTTHGYRPRSHIVRLPYPPPCNQTTRIVRALPLGIRRHLQVRSGTHRMPPQVHPHIQILPIHIPRVGPVPFLPMHRMAILRREWVTGAGRVRQR
jgi:hypothetical protein